MLVLSGVSSAFALYWCAMGAASEEREDEGVFAFFVCSDLFFFFG